VCWVQVDTAACLARRRRVTDRQVPITVGCPGTGPSTDPPGTDHQSDTERITHGTSHLGAPCIRPSCAPLEEGPRPRDQHRALAERMPRTRRRWARPAARAPLWALAPMRRRSMEPSLGRASGIRFLGRGRTVHTVSQ
jgi:hypothetical protein